VRFLNGRGSNSGKHWPTLSITGFSLMTGMNFSASLDKEVEIWGIRVLRSPVRMPTANAHCERLIGTIRRACLNYLIPLNAFHLRRTLREWICHYNGGRPHRSLGPDVPNEVQQNAPASDRVGPRQQAARVIAKPVLDGLDHECRWVKTA
jgi:putative transposase